LKSSVLDAGDDVEIRGRSQAVTLQKESAAAYQNEVRLLVLFSEELTKHLQSAFERNRSHG
jgi:hypothetical protein